jgi:uncharacterized membrane protein HdeD (DUF308 family)
MNSPLESFTNGIKAVGVLFILAGTGVFAVALLVPNLMGLILAILFMVGGTFRITYAVLSRSEAGFWLKLAAGILYAVAGLILLTGIFQRYASVSVVLGVVLVLEGLLDLALGLKLPQSQSRQWFLVGSTIALLMGLLLASGLVAGVAWLLGILGGLTLAAPGVWFILLARSMGRTDADQRRANLRRR